MSHTFKWFMSHIWTSHVTYMNESCHTYEWDTHINESCPTRWRLFVKRALHPHQKGPISKSKKSYTHVKKAPYPQKRPWITAKEPYISAKEPYISATEPHISAKKLHIHIKRAIYLLVFGVRRSMPFCRFKSAEKASYTPGKCPKYTSKEPCMLKHPFIFSVEAIHNFLEIQIRGKSLKYEWKES